MQKKQSTDIVAMTFLACAIVTGFFLHKEVHHLYIYDNTLLWAVHIVSGVVAASAIIVHCIQHKFWFKNYRKIPVGKKRVTSLLFIVSILVTISGIILASGSHSNFISIFHYVSAIVFTLLAIGHVVKRWKFFRYSL